MKMRATCATTCVGPFNRMRRRSRRQSVRSADSPAADPAHTAPRRSLEGARQGPAPTNSTNNKRSTGRCAEGSALFASADIPSRADNCSEARGTGGTSMAAHRCGTSAAVAGPSVAGSAGPDWHAARMAGSRLAWLADSVELAGGTAGSRSACSADLDEFAGCERIRLDGPAAAPQRRREEAAQFLRLRKEGVASFPAFRTT